MKYVGELRYHFVVKDGNIDERGYLSARTVHSDFFYFYINETVLNSYTSWGALVGGLF